MWTEYSLAEYVRMDGERLRLYRGGDFVGAEDIGRQLVSLASTHGDDLRNARARRDIAFAAHRQHRLKYAYRTIKGAVDGTRRLLADSDTYRAEGDAEVFDVRREMVAHHIAQFRICCDLAIDLDGTTDPATDDVYEDLAESGAYINNWVFTDEGIRRDQYAVNAFSDVITHRKMTGLPYIGKALKFAGVTLLSNSRHVEHSPCEGLINPGRLKTVGRQLFKVVGATVAPSKITYPTQ